MARCAQGKAKAKAAPRTATGKRKAAQSASGGSKSAGKAPKAAVAPQQQYAPSTTGGDDEKTVRSQAGRRDLDAKVDRAMECGRLDHIPRSVLASRRSAKGLSIRKFVEDGIIKLNGEGKNLASKFWCELFTAFNLHDVVPLDPPDVADGLPTEEMLEALEHVHHENPIKATAVPMQRLLAHTGPLTQQQTYGTLKAIQSAPDMTPMNAVKCQVAFLKYWHRSLGSCHPPPP